MHRTRANRRSVAAAFNRFCRASHGSSFIAGDRLFIEAVLFRAKTGFPWRDLPERFGPWKFGLQPLRELGRARDISDAIFNELQLEVDETGSIVDGSARPCTPRCVGRKRGIQCKCFWPLSRRFFRLKSTPSSTSKGRPLHIALTPGQRHEMIAAHELLEHARGNALIGDTGYDSNDFRASRCTTRA